MNTWFDEKAAYMTPSEGPRCRPPDFFRFNMLKQRSTNYRNNEQRRALTSSCCKFPFLWRIRQHAIMHLSFLFGRESIADLPCRNPSPDFVRWHISSNNCSGSDYRTTTDMHACHDDGSITDPNITLYSCLRHRRASGEYHRGSGFVESVIRANNCHSGGEHHVWTQFNVGPNRTFTVDETELPRDKIAANC
jgi:hypothetical protein